MNQESIIEIYMNEDDQDRKVEIENWQRSRL